MQWQLAIPVTVARVVAKPLLAFIFLFLKPSYEKKRGFASEPNSFAAKGTHSNDNHTRTLRTRRQGTKSKQETQSNGTRLQEFPSFSRHLMAPPYTSHYHYHQTHPYPPLTGTSQYRRWTTTLHSLNSHHEGLLELDRRYTYVWFTGPPILV